MHGWQIIIFSWIDLRRSYLILEIDNYMHRDRDRQK